MQRRFLLCLLVLIAGAVLATADPSPIVRLGLITDLHAHDIDSPLEGKWMTHTEERLATFTTAMNAWAPDFVIELGDFVNGWAVFGVDPGDPARIPDILAWANGLYRQFDGPAYYVLGNHDLYNLDKKTILDILGIDATYYSFDVGTYHFVVLDVQYATDGSDLATTYTGVAGFVPDPEMAWLRADLDASHLPTIICVHQRLDDFIEQWGRPTILNQAVVQQALAEDGDVIAVFQGHDHTNAHNVIDGIHYVTFEAMVDQNTPPSWAQITLEPETHRIVIEGFGDQASYDLSYP